MSICTLEDLGTHTVHSTTEELMYLNEQESMFYYSNDLFYL